MTYQCQKCNGPIPKEQHYRNPKFCSMECFRANTVGTVTKYCLCCGKQYTRRFRTTKTPKYCSDTCSQKARNGQHFTKSAERRAIERQKRQTKEAKAKLKAFMKSVIPIKQFKAKEDRVCQQCNEVFLGAKGRKYCSTDCQNERKRELAKGPTLYDYQCKGCKNNFQSAIRPVGNSRQPPVYCSFQCRADTKAQRLINNTCAGCGIAFTSNKHGDRKRLYCTAKCKTDKDSRDALRHEICEHCHKPFSRKQSDKTAFRFCTPKCANLASIGRKNSHEHIEKARAGALKSYQNGRQPVKLGRHRVKYKGITFDSSWEIILAKRLNKIGIYWVRGVSVPWVDKKGRTRSYFPDFYLPKYEIALEPKSPHILDFGNQREKCDYIKKHYPNVVFLWSQKECEDYVLQDT